MNETAQIYSYEDVFHGNREIPIKCHVFVTKRTRGGKDGVFDSVVMLHKTAG